jgi:DNA-binding LytR/AlgR family response regulator
MAIRTAVVDDEPLAVEILKDYVEKTAGLKLVMAGSDVFKTLQLLQSGELDLVLLDIQMPELTGIQFMKIVGDSSKIIVTTAYPDYALEGYELNVADYLLKPISYERFLKAISKIKVATGNSAAVPDEPAVPDLIFVKSEYKLVKIMLNDILYIESLRDYIAIYTTKNEKIMTLESLRNMEQTLPAANFVRVHKSFIVSLSKIKFVERNRIIIQDKHIPVGESYQKDFYEKLKP